MAKTQKATSRGRCETQVLSRVSSMRLCCLALAKITFFQWDCAVGQDQALPCAMGVMGLSLMAGWPSLVAQNSPRLPEQCQEMALWGWVGLVSIISVSSLDFGNRVVVVLQEIL